MKVLVTGIAGFIGHAVAKRLAEQGHEVFGIDNFNDYYDVELKRARILDLSVFPDIKIFEMDVCDRSRIAELFSAECFDCVVHLAAQAGVRYSLENPHAYVDSNVVGHLNILEGCRHNGVSHLVYASSSSVYGMNEYVPFSTTNAVDHPVSLYAATKKANELMSHTYSHLYGIPTTGLRFFTVYGPWGRPDMAPFKFVKSLLEGESIDVYNHGKMQRDFTYIDDIVEGVFRVLFLIPQYGGKSDSPDNSSAPYSLYNIGNGCPVALMDFINAIEKSTGCAAKCNFKAMQPGDVTRTWADNEPLFFETGYKPIIGVEEGVANFVNWYREFYQV